MRTIHNAGLAAAGVSVVVGLLLAAPPANAASTAHNSEAKQPVFSTIQVGTAGQAGVSGARDCKVTSPWNHVGYLKCGSHAQAADWDGNGTVDEVFGVTGDRRIWHDWKNAGKWVEMPNSGRADDTYDWGWSNNGTRRAIDVKVGSSQVWRSEFYDSNWHAWRRIR
ncbi:hypothetical protein [Streptomyces sp. NPDC059009]|uniref:hypothetical protein n=1 Tax=Streptomyces sp. NPDC059009 TaxID=3346694 RepID=UPI003682275F